MEEISTPVHVQVSKHEATNTTPREIILTRILNAPRQLVFKAWTDPQHITQWWGPTGFTSTILEMNVVPGGIWRFVMHSAEGVDYKNKIVYREVTKPERLIYSQGSDDESDSGAFNVTTTFAERGGKTKLTLWMLFDTVAERNKIVESGAIEGGNQTLDRLEAYLAKM